MCLFGWFRKTKPTPGPAPLTPREKEIEYLKNKYPAVKAYLETPEGRRQLSKAMHNPIHDQDTMANAEARYYAKRDENYNTDGGFDPGIG